MWQRCCSARNRRFAIVRSETEIAARFWTKYDVGEGPNPCWTWNNYRLPSGYGLFTTHYPERVYAHRLAHELAIGPIPEGYEVDHLCRNRGCINPAHLEAVTPQENKRRSSSPAQLNTLKTHCPQGHPYDEENTYAYRGMRMCRACQTVRNRTRNDEVRAKERSRRQRRRDRIRAEG